MAGALPDSFFFTPLMREESTTWLSNLFCFGSFLMLGGVLEDSTPIFFVECDYGSLFCVELRFGWCRSTCMVFLPILFASHFILCASSLLLFEKEEISIVLSIYK